MFPVDFNSNTWCSDRYCSRWNTWNAISISRLSHGSDRLTTQLYGFDCTSLSERERRHQQHWTPGIFTALLEAFKVSLKKRCVPRPQNSQVSSWATASYLPHSKHNAGFVAMFFKQWLLQTPENRVSKHSRLRIWTNQEPA